METLDRCSAKNLKVIAKEATYLDPRDGVQHYAIEVKCTKSDCIIDKSSLVHDVRGVDSDKNAEIGAVQRILFTCPFNSIPLGSF